MCSKNNLPIAFLNSCFLFLLLLPTAAHAEAFKGGFLSAGQEKALFFLLFLVIIGAVVGATLVLTGIWEWLNTGKKDKLKKYIPLILVGFIVLALVCFVLLLAIISL